MEEKKPADFITEDFISSESFLNFYLHKSKADEIFWEEWLLSNAGKASQAKEALAILDCLFLRLPENEFQVELEKMKAKTGAAIPVIAKKPSLIRLLNWNKKDGIRQSRKKRMIVYLIPVAFLLIAGVYFFTQRSALPAAVLIEKHNNGQTPLELILSDSTIVTLASNSTVRYPKQFGNIDRKVWLDGTATFHVRRDELHPFKVYAKEVVATVLGTLFNVKEPKGDAVVIIELLKGKLQVEAGDKLPVIILNPNERVVYTAASRRMFKEAWLPQEDLLQNHLVFSKDNFSAIALKIKNVFGITVINQSHKNNWRFTGSFNNSTAKDIIANICLVEQLNYEQNGDTILIK